MQTNFLVKFLILSLTSWSCQISPSPDDTKDKKALIVDRTPAEFEPLDAVWLIWPPSDHLEGYSNEQVLLEIVDALIPHTKVILTAANDVLMKKAKAALPASAMEGGQIELLAISSEEFWTRDMGPNYVILKDGRKAIVDFNFNAWGYTPIDSMDEYTIRLEKFDELVATKTNRPLISTNLISEGGDREVNGKGVLMVVETVELGRNPNMTKTEIEAEFNRVLGVEKIIWLKQGLFEDDHTFLGPKTLEDGTKGYTVVTTNGHIDEFARFVNDSTILLAQVAEEDLEDPIGLENHRRMEENYQILKTATDQDGKPFHIVRMTLPKTVLGTLNPGDPVYETISSFDYQDGSTFPMGKPITAIAAASYLNFLITDKVVIGQKYWRPGLDEDIKARDESAKETLTSVFPNRKIVMIDAVSVNFGGGGVHCITMQEPAIGNY